jgi:hypothetical protein
VSIREVSGGRYCSRKKNGSETRERRRIAVAADVLTKRYEDLRRQALEGGAFDRGLGLAMLLRQGMWYWLESWSKCTATAPAPEVSATTPVESVPAALQGEIATILTGMALSYRRMEAIK